MCGELLRQGAALHGLNPKFVRAIMPTTHHATPAASEGRRAQQPGARWSQQGERAQAVGLLARLLQAAANPVRALLAPAAAVTTAPSPWERSAPKPSRATSAVPVVGGRRFHRWRGRMGARGA